MSNSILKVIQKQVYLYLPGGTPYTSRKNIIWSACGDGGKKMLLFVCLLFVCLFVCFEEQQNVIYFILENEGDYEAIFVNCETGTIFSNEE